MITEQTLNVLQEFKQALIDELEAYVKINADSAKWKLDYYKKHRTKDNIVELFSAPQTFDLASYYAYGNSKDIVEEKFNEILKKQNLKGIDFGFMFCLYKGKSVPCISFSKKDFGLK